MKQQMHKISMIIIFLLGTLVSQGQINLDNGLIRHYQFNGDATDISANAIDGTVHGAVSAERYALPNQCYQTDGSAGDNITVPTVGNWGDNLVMSMWFNPDSLNASNNYSYLSYSRNSNLSNYMNFYTAINHVDSTVRFVVASNAGHGVITSSNQVNLKTWNHLYVSHDKVAGILEIVLNGVSTTLSWSNAPKYKNTPIGFGDFNDDVTSSLSGFTGRIDEIRIYNRQLNAAEVDSLADATAFPLGLDYGLIRHYPLDGDAMDASGNAVDGTIHGAVSASRYDIMDKCYETTSAAGDNITVPLLGNWGDNLVISMWFYPESIDTQNAVSNLIFSRGVTGAYQNFFSNIQHSDSTIRFLVASNSGHGQIYSSNKVNFGEWNHVVVYHDGASDSIGIVLNSIRTELAWANTPRYKNVNIGFGNYNDNVSPANGFNGRMDEIRFYNRQLNQEEIDSLGDASTFDVGLDYALVAYYPLDNDALDASGNGNDGIENNVSYVNDVCGGPLNALDFDASNPSSVNIGNNVDPQGFPMAISLWMNIDDIQAEQFVLRTGQWQSGVKYNGLVMKINNGLLSVAYGDNTGAGAGSRRTYISDSAEVGENAWHHVVVNIKGKHEFELYVDTVQSSSTTYSGSANNIVNTNQNGFLGTGYQSQKGLTGSLDEVRIYDRALSGEDIDSLFSRGCTITGLNELSTEENEKLFFYPNPAQSEIFLEGMVEQIRILNLSGQIVLEGFNVQNVNVSELNSGVYIIEGVLEDKIFVNKLIVTK